MVGYLRLAPNATPELAHQARARLNAFAAREDLILVDVLTELESSADSAFATLVATVLRTGASGVLTLGTQAFARLPRLHRAMEEQLERQTGAQVIVIGEPAQRREPSQARAEDEPA